MDYKSIIGVTAVIISIVGVIPYFKDILAGKTKPHAFSWLVWGILTGIGFAGQVAGGAGPGAWVTGFSSLTCFVIFIAGVVKGRTNIVLLDWLSLLGAGIALILWYVTENPLYSIILIIIIDAFGFYPTVRKSYYKPYEETLIFYFLNGFKMFISLFALSNYTLTTLLYPIYLIAADWLFITMLHFRRKLLL